MLNKKLVVGLAASVTMATMLSACVVAPKVEKTTGDITYGKQLIDLKQALESEAISEAEYQKAKQAILNSMDKLKHKHK